MDRTDLCREVIMGGMRKRAGQAVVEALVAEKVDTVFGLAGSHIHAICDALIDEEGIRFVVCKHENNAALMADLYGRVTGRPGVCLVTAGPGATNSMTGVAQAFAAASPVIHITGTVARGAKKGAFHGLDRADFLYRTFQDVTKWSVRVEEAEDIPRIVAEAFSIARGGRSGPVHIELPEDLLEEPATEIWDHRRVSKAVGAVDQDLVRAVTEALLAAKRPVICAGVGVRAAGATRELVLLAESLGAAVTFPRNATDLFPAAHQLCVGAFDAYPSNPFPLQLVEQSDLLLVVGMRAGTSAAETLGARAPAEYIFLTPDGEIEGSERATISAAVNIRALLEDLTHSLSGEEVVPAGWATQQIAEAKELLRKGLDRASERYRGQRPIHFGLALKELIPLLDEDTLVVGDIGNHGVWASWWFSLNSSQAFLEPGTWGSMGFALPGAIAAKLAYPERQVVGITGDGAFLMSCSDFGTALEAGANIVIVVLNDGQYGMIHTLQSQDYGRTIGTELRGPDLVKFAESYGALGIRVEDDSELRDAFTKALAADCPVIVDVVCGYEFPPPAPEEWLLGVET
jgi:acetolactate synthase-1/2/3 large subunit